MNCQAPRHKAKSGIAIHLCVLVSLWRKYCAVISADFKITVYAKIEVYKSTRLFFPPTFSPSIFPPSTFILQSSSFTLLPLSFNLLSFPTSEYLFPTSAFPLPTSAFPPSNFPLQPLTFYLYPSTFFSLPTISTSHLLTFCLFRLPHSDFEIQSIPALRNVIVNYPHQHNAGYPKSLTQQQQLCTHFRRKYADIARQLMAQSPHGKGQDISDQQGQHGLFDG